MQKIFHFGKLKVVIVLPAYNAAKTVRDTYLEIPAFLRKHIILVDDGSSDNTVGTAKDLGLKVIEHPNNIGYGGNQKTCYKEAMKLNPDIVVMVHPDYQYDASMIEDLIYPIARGRYDFMFGSRIANKQGALAGGMPPLKYYVNRIVCLIQNILLGVNFTEHFSGFRAYSKKLLLTLPWQKFSNDFVFDQEMTISAIDYGFAIGEIAIPTRYHEKASSIRFLKGTKFVLEGFFVIVSFYLHKLGLVKDKRFEKIKPSNSGKYFMAFLGITLINLILYGILTDNLIFGLLLLTESILLYLNLVGNHLITRFIACIVLIFLILISLDKNYDTNLFYSTPRESSIQASRHEYYALELGKLYKNQVGITYTQTVLPITTKITKNMFSHLTYDSLLNVQNIMSLVLVPLFFLGIFEAVQRMNKFTICYLLVVFVIGGLLTFEGRYGYLLYVPVVNLLILLGIYKLNHCLHPGDWRG